MQNRFEKQTAYLSEGDGNEKSNMELISNTKEWAVHRLFLDDNQRQSIIKEIQHIQFSCMTFLSVSYNTISSIEGVDRVSMPHLRNIQFANNHIIDVAAIRKAGWRSLLSLTLYNNCIRDHGPLAEGNFPKLSSLRMTWEGVSDPCFPSKLQTQALFTLYSKNDKFPTKQRSIGRVLANKWQLD